MKGQKSPGSRSSSRQSLTTGFPRAAGKWPLEERDQERRAELTPSPSGVNGTKVNPKTGAGGVEVRSGGVARVG